MTKYINLEFSGNNKGDDRLTKKTTTTTASTDPTTTITTTSTMTKTIASLESTAKAEDIEKISEKMLREFC